MADNTEFCEQIGNALLTLGTAETLSCMARMMAAIACKADKDLAFDCDIGTVTITRKKPKLNG